MDGHDLGFDLDVILNAIDTAEVMIVRFPFIAKRLLIDARGDGGDPPVIALVPQASGIEERFRSVKQARQNLPVPDRIISFQWPRHAGLLEPAGVWQRVVARLIATGHPDVKRRCDEVWHALLAEERREVMVAIRGGDRYETVWERASQG